MADYTHYRNNLETQTCPICEKTRPRDWFGFGQTVCKRCWALRTAEAQAHTEALEALLEPDEDDLEAAVA